MFSWLTFYQGTNTAGRQILYSYRRDAAAGDIQLQGDTAIREIQLQ
jgi:hypothetical protein